MKYIKKLSKSNILLLFIGWRFGLFLVAFLAVFLIPDFGGRFPYANNQLMNTGLPDWVWGFGNFDGVHYLRLVQMGYEGSKFSQAFFPLYPLFLKLTAFDSYYLLSALIITNMIFLASLYLLSKLFEQEFGPKTSLKAIGLLLAFPTAFYFGAVYSEALFLLLTVASLLLIRKKQFFWAGLVIALASATRIVGILLVPVLLWEIFLVWKEKEKFNPWAAISGMLLAPLGTLFYILYLKINFNSPFYFFSAQPEFGAERSQSIILLPQVFFRYIKILFSVSVNSLSFFNAALEILFTAVPLLIIILAYKKIRFSYWLFVLGCLILPTLTGTLSSMPRYSLMGFLVVPVVVNWLGKLYFPTLVGLVVFEAVLLTLFIRGYWVA